MPKRLDITAQERRERKRHKDRQAEARRQQRNVDLLAEFKFRHETDRGGRSEPPPEVLEEANRAAMAPRTLTAIMFGDPPPGRRAIDRVRA